ncbi:septum formation family protein [Streptomyces sp. NBC_00525]|uniref:septum formation family protein n=1 Tax=Streptomyces sp. NBC_00525 TaxID=2903660 RepID=UPI002E8203B8|nr:septum formation family protein [Streptomyces sp. NBC_00525]WUC95074.1 septum formation family protein [Streptomyces sp. NBC_00525]
MRNHLASSLAAAVLAALMLSGCATTDGEAKGSGPGVGESADSRDAMSDLPRGTPVPFSDLKVGMCSNFQGDVRSDEEVGTVDCATPHRFEILSEGTLPEGKDSPFPGDRGVMSAMRTVCEPVLEPLVSKNRGSIIGLLFVPLNKESWESGNRTGYCAVTFPEPKTGKLGKAA